MHFVVLSHLLCKHALGTGQPACTSTVMLIGSSAGLAKQLVGNSVAGLRCHIPYGLHLTSSDS